MIGIVPSRRRLLWSGGFDSTAYLLEQLRAGERVEVYYAPTGGEFWQKTRRELDARERIVSALPASWRSRLVDAGHIPYDWQVYHAFDQAWGELLERRRGEWWSDQAPLVAGLARLIPRLEAAYVSGDVTLEHQGRALFHAWDLTLPIAHVTKRQLLDQARANGLERILALTWSCEADDGRPGACGECDPCRARIIPQTVRVN